MQLRGWLAHDSLPADAELVSVDVTEGVSSLFEIACTFVCDDPDLDLDAFLWSSALVGIDDLDGGPSCRFHGIVENVEYETSRGSRHVYHLVARPQIHGLAYRVRSRIFQQKTAVDVIKEVFSEAGIPADHVVWHVIGTYPTREYCVQYRESELAFVLRLLEEEGAFYWFEHSDDGHVLHIGDDNKQFTPVAGDDTISVSSYKVHDTRETLSDILFTTRVTNDAMTSRDWCFEKPGKPLEASAEDSPDAALETYEYPGRFDAMADGQRKMEQRLKELGIRKYVLDAATNCRRLLAGKTFQLADCKPDYVCQEYVLLRVVHHFDQHAKTAEAGLAGQGYRSFLHAMPTATVYRPARTTPRPRIFGKESAVVTGPAGEEIHVDDMGRIKVHFYWDREGKIDDTATCWIRVQQQNTSGSMILPRIGWEVEVAFIDGDPDRPIVMQKLYNQETMPPYGLPANKTQSALQSSTSPGGGSTNEIRLQDGNGGMEAFIHASKDFALAAGHDMSEDIAVDAKEEVGLTSKSIVGASETYSIGGKQGISVTATCSHETVGSKTITVGGSDDWGVGTNYSIVCDGSRTETIGGLMNVLANHVDETFNADHKRSVAAAQMIVSATAIVEAVGGSKKELVGAAKLEIIGKAKSEAVGTAKTLIAGMVLEKSGEDIGLNAKGAVSIACGGPYVEKCGGDFTLGAKAILITAAGGLKMTGGGSKFDAASGKITVNASSLGASGGPQLQLKGTINYKP
jgi:type VI secretion system secreted protein VgrG